MSRHGGIIEALHTCHSRSEGASLRGEQFVSEHICAARQTVDKQVGRRVAVLLIEPQSLAGHRPWKLLHRLEGGSPVILNNYIAQIGLHFEHKRNLNAVARAERA